MCPHTFIWRLSGVGRYATDASICVLIHLYTFIYVTHLRHTSIYVSSYLYICVRIPLYICPHTFICVRMPLCMCPQIFVSACLYTRGMVARLSGVGRLTHRAMRTLI